MKGLTDSCEYVIEKIKALLTEIPVKIFPQQQQIFTTSAMVFINNLNKAVRGKELRLGPIEMVGLIELLNSTDD